jgi:hypothetical protein
VAKAIITRDQHAVISEVEIAAPLDRVFQGGPAELDRTQRLLLGLARRSATS